MIPSSHHFIKKTASLLGCCLLFLSFSSYAGDCDMLSAWKKLKASTPATLQDRTDKSIRLYDLQMEISQQFYSEYMAGKTTNVFFSKCLADISEKDEWTSSFSQVFLRNSLLNLQAAPIPRLQKIMTELQATQIGQGMTLFKAAPHFPGEEGAKKAGVYRGSTSLFMNIDMIPAGEWNFLLVHELFHYLDPVIKKASLVWNSKETAAKIFELGKIHETLETLSPVEKKMLRDFVQAGLDRGLLAEYRAWVLCFSIYEQGKKTGLWKTIPWMEEIIVNKSNNESWESFTFNFLDSRFDDPDFTGIFSVRIMQEQYHLLRNELRN